MNSILQQLYESNSEFIDKMSSKYPQYNAIWKKISDEGAYLLKKLTVEDGERLTNMEDDLREAYCMEIYESFTCGFRLGMGLLWEVINEDA